MRAKFKSLLGYGVLIAAVLLVTHYWPDTERLINAGFGWLGAIFVVAVLAGAVWVFASSAVDRLRDAWRQGYPTAFHRSRRNPPWENPRRVDSLGSRQDRADFRLLQARLTKLPGPVPHEILSGIGRRDAPRNDYFDPVLYLDRATGQHWVEDGYEVGFNQWTEFIPVQMPD